MASNVAHTLPPVNLTAAEATTIAVALSNRRATPFTAAGRSALLKIMAVMAEDDAAGARALAQRVRFFEPDDSAGAGDGDGGDGGAGAVVGGDGGAGVGDGGDGRRAPPAAGTNEPPRRAAPGADRAVLEQAIVERRVTRLVYVDRRGAVTERVVEPVAVVGLVPEWYLVAWCRLRGDFRYFRLDRVLGAQLTVEVGPDRGEVPMGPPGFVGRSPAFD